VATGTHAVRGWAFRAVEPFRGSARVIGVGGGRGGCRGGGGRGARAERGRGEGGGPRGDGEWGGVVARGVLEEAHERRPDAAAELAGEEKEPEYRSERDDAVDLAREQCLHHVDVADREPDDEHESIGERDVVGV